MAADLTLSRHHRGGEVILAALIGVWLVAVSVWPLARLFMEALAPGKDGAPLGLMAEVLTARATGRAVWNTLAVSAGSVVISSVLGVLLALVTGLFALRGRVAMTFLILSPLLIPSQTMALAWIELIGPTSPILRPLGLAPPPGTTNPIYSGWGIALLLGIEHMPLVFVATRAALIALPGDLVEAAQVAGARRGRIVARILAPLVAPAALAGAVLAFAAAVGNFGVPALLGIPGRFPMLTTLIYQRLNGFGPSVAGQVAVLALILVLMAVAALVLRAVILRWLTVPLGRGAGLTPFDPGRARPVLEAGVWSLLAMIAVLPLLALLGTALSPALGVPLSADTVTLRNFADVLANSMVIRAFRNSLMLAFVAAGVCTVIALPFAFLKVQARMPAIRVLDWLVDAPWVVPGTVVALAMILAFLQPLPLVGSLYGTFWILLVAYLARFLPLVLRPVIAAAEAMEPALDEAARIAGAGSLRRVALIMAPMVLPAATAGAMLLVMTALNELTLSALLWSSGTETLGVMVFALQYEGNSAAAAAVSILSVALVLAIAVLLDRLARHLPPGALPWRS
ncbi:iron(III) transport system permease protein [Gemmobacter megaterium]|uniref:Iron(III) transport system permease protein n=1 Tax=Gemmobacter megaterium TaxID=1086013 RepID=A0A1N7PJ48_9RHOB|nr:iron ABC transporter permease [Gemmobacter megaterium]GGE17920.1 iron ABC transporter permease [Gemmobacter megaterium]SIT10621.1 iron(III) transport system permease protein [Gemmobacter megaterium]